MKKIFLVTLFVAFLLLPGKALALDLQETQQFQALNSYVLALAERSDADATSEEKQTYRERLALRRDNALERLGNLRERRVLQAKKDYKKRKTALLSKLQKKLSKEQKRAESSFASDLSRAKETLRSRLAELDERYGQEIKSIKKKISALRKKLKKTKDASRRIEIGNEINSLQGALSPLEGPLKKGRKKALDTYRSQKGRLEKELKRDLSRAKKDFSQSWDQGQRDLQKGLENNISLIISTTASERKAVVDLYRKGQEIISAMPTPSKKKAKKAHRKGPGR